MMIDNSVMAQTDSNQKTNWQTWATGIGLILLLLLAGWFFIFRNGVGGVDLPPTMNDSEFEALTGAKVTLIAVTGGGGFVDFRVRIVDTEKATAFFADPANAPSLLVEESGVVLPPPADAEFDAELEERGYFMLYANANNAVQQGTLVSVVIGDMRLEAIPAQ
ncbi:MAG: hypothetical protein DWQ04_16205 [Chloroflexi bacterium]|nr:MAG: hypothetical protein DWQ04_16205 [Chloroflexota bacterium]